MPSLTEGLPDAVLESLACETPVIASAVGEIPYVLREGKCGWIIWNYGVDTFVKALKEALTDHETLKELGRRGREFVSKKFKWEYFVEGTVRLLEKALENH